MGTRRSWERVNLTKLQSRSSEPQLPSRAPRELSWLAIRRLRFGLVLLLAVAGIFLIHFVFTASSTGTRRAASAGTAPAAPTGSVRILLAGTSLYSYDVASRHLQALAVPDSAPTQLLRLLALRGGNVVSTPSGRVYGAALGHQLRLIANASTVLPDHDGDSLWLITGRLAQLADVNGKTFGKPYTLPAAERVVAALDRGLLLAPAKENRAGPIDVVDPRSGLVVRTVTAHGIVSSAAGDHVAWSGCAAPTCPTEVTELSSDTTEALPALPAGYLAVGQPVLSPDNRHYAVAAQQFGGTSVDLVVGRIAVGNRAFPSRVAGLLLVNFSHAVAYARNGTLIANTVHGLTTFGQRSFRGGRPLPGLPAFYGFAIN